jgi:hypothetical protein
VARIAPSTDTTKRNSPSSCGRARQFKLIAWLVTGTPKYQRKSEQTSPGHSIANRKGCCREHRGALRESGQRANSMPPPVSHLDDPGSDNAAVIETWPFGSASRQGNGHEVDILVVAAHRKRGRRIWVDVESKILNGG